MSVFVLKLLAVLSMLTDHTAFFLKSKALIGSEVYTLMRSVGRFAFPVFCFLIANGYEKTSDRSRYLSRLTGFAFLSQIPFSLVFNPSNYYRAASGGLAFRYPALLCVILIAAAAFCWYKTVRPDLSVLLPAAALFLCAVRLGIGGVFVCSVNLNVFYTLALGLALICFADGLSRTGALPPSTILLQLLGLAAAFFLIRGNSDYELVGALLIVLLWAVQDRKWQVLLILAWCFFQYRSVPYLIAALTACPAVALYNGKLGRPFRSGFYLIYPVHLLFLGLLVFLI